MTNMFLGFADGLWSLSSRCFTWLWVEGAWRPPQWRCAAGRPERPRRCTCRPSAGGSNSQRLSSPPALFPELNIQRSNSTHTDEDYNSLFFFFYSCNLATSECVFSLWKQSARPWWCPSARGTRRTACVSLTTGPATRSVRHLWERRRHRRHQSPAAL